MIKANHMASLIVCSLFVACATVTPQVTPQTADEQAIGRLIAGIVAAYNARDLEAQLTAYAPDAKIESLVIRGTLMSRDQHAALRRTWTPRGTVYLRSLDVKILAADEAEATAFFRLVDDHQDMIGRRAFRLVRRSGQWRIIEARFVGPVPWDPK